MKDNFGVSEFVTKVSNPYFSVLKEAPKVNDVFMRKAIEFAWKNKVFPLFYEGCLKLRIDLPKDAHTLMANLKRRKQMQDDAVDLLLDISEKLGIDLVFFKTFKPFNYIPDDIDILLRRKEDLKPLIERLKDYGYFVLKVGTPEIVLRKISKGAYVDLDIHTRLAVGHLDLFNVEDIWREKAYKEFKTSRGYKGLKLSEEYEVVREAAYSLLKDLTLSIQGLYLAIYAVNNIDIEATRRIAAKKNLLLHYLLFLDTAYYITLRLFGEYAVKRPYTGTEIDNNVVKLALKLIKADLNRRFRLPYNFPLTIVALAYIAKVYGEIRCNRNLKALYQVAMQPSSKGVGIFLDYFFGKFS